jgi:membrane-associated phospholipid phosphatase
VSFPNFFRALSCACFILLGSSWSPRAQAQTKVLVPPLLRSDDSEPPSLWRAEWPEFRTSEGVATIASGLATLAIVLYGPIERPRWQGPILFDAAARDALRADSSETRQTYRTVGDWTYRLSPVLPLLDVFVVSAAARSDSKLAWNLGATTFEAYSYSGLASFISTEISARQRPYSQCLEDGECDTQSFYSGHSAIAATGAGLVCANHTRIALYGNPVADVGACVVASANAVTTAVTRLVADRHYATDVVVGTGLGFAFGYAVPVLLHYSYGDSARSISFAPDPKCGASCIGMRGTF